MGHDPNCACCGRSDDEILDSIAEHVEGEGSTFVFTIGAVGQPGEPGAHPPFSYTIGMWRNFGAPEIMTYVIHPGVLNEVRERVREGLVIHPHKRVSKIAKGFDAIFAEVTGNDDVFNMARFYYERRGKPDDLTFPRMQLIWPDEFNIFPWEEGFNEKFRQHQIELGKWPAKGAKIL
jgi:hypothetical protein